MLADFFYRIFLRLFSKRLVRAAYRGILGRAADDDGLAAYSRELVARRDLAWVLADLAQSEESRQKIADSAPRVSLGVKLGEADAGRLVDAAFVGLLHRAPEPEALAAYTRLLVDSGDIAQFLSEIGHSQEHRERLLGPARRPRTSPRI